jgi:hypothetical protein
LVGETFELALLEFIVAHAPNRILRGIDIQVRDDDELNVAFIFERTQPFAFFIDEVGRYLHWDLSDDFGGTIFAGFLADESEHGQCHGLDRANTADTLTAGADLVA